MAATVAPTLLDRLKLAVRLILREEFPRLTFLGTYGGTVQRCDSDGGTIDVQPTDTSVGLPGITSVPQRFCALTAQPQQGQLVLLQFMNGDPTLPMIVGTVPVPANATLDAATHLQLGPSSSTVDVAGGGAPIARKGDLVNAGYLVISALGNVVSYFPGDVPPSQVNFNAATTAANNISGSVISFTGGVIAAGSGKANSG